MENQSLAEGQMGLYRMVQLEIMGARHAMSACSGGCVFGEREERGEVHANFLSSFEEKSR